MLRFKPKGREKRSIPPELASLGVPQRLLELLCDRGINTPEAIAHYLHPRKEDLHDPMLMQDMDKAVTVVRDALCNGEEIVIFGDYDVDGVTATAILLTYLRKQGASATFYIPDRHGEGYGLNMAAIEQIAAHAKLLITVDCGITCAKEVARARELGMRVIVTDHHQLGEELPQCEAVLNPLLGDYPFKKLCGAGVAFKLVQALGGMQAVEPLWELCALATIADIVPLLGENRVIVSCGLQAMSETQRPGLLALMESSGVNPSSITASDIAYRMAPRINAGGRLALASRGVELLITRRTQTARQIAAELNQDNICRRELEMDIYKSADERARREIDFLNERAIVLCGEGWNPGVIGLAASRLADKYRWPTVLLSQDGEICVGSARSIPGVDIHAAMATCRDLFMRFGGHAQAAGLTLKAEHVPEFRRRLTEAIKAQAAPDAFIPTEEYDLELELSEMTESLVEAFEAMQPTGFGNPSPVFCVRGAQALDARAFGKDDAHLRLRLMQGGETRSAIAFRMGEMAPSMPEVIDAVVSLSFNEWQGRRSVQCEVRKFKAHAPAEAFLEECQRRELEIDERFLSAISLRESAPVQAGRVQRVTFEQALRLVDDEQLYERQGTVLCVHTLPALKQIKARIEGSCEQLDYALGALEDVRMFSTLLMAPDWEAFAREPVTILALDGFLCEGERAQAASRFPGAQLIEVTDMGQHQSAEASRLLPEDGTLREIYRALLQREQTGIALSVLAAQTNVSQSAVLCALHIFRELELLDFTLQPFEVHLTRIGHVSLEDSALRARLRALREKTLH